MSNAILIIPLFVMTGLLVLIYGYIFWSKGRTSKLLTEGVAGTAVITSFTSKPVLVMGAYPSKVGLRITLPGQAPYDVVLSESLAMAEIARYQVGLTVGVRVDPNDPSKAAIDWSVGVLAAGAPPTAAPYSTAAAPGHIAQQVSSDAPAVATSSVLA